MKNKNSDSLTKHEWTFLTNHTHVLVCLYRNPNCRIRELADLVGITERAVAKILDDLESAKVIYVEKQGRRNSYKINTATPLRHSLESHKTIGELLRFIK